MEAEISHESETCHEYYPKSGSFNHAKFWTHVSLERKIKSPQLRSLQAWFIELLQASNQLAKLIFQCLWLKEFSSPYVKTQLKYQSARPTATGSRPLLPAPNT
jgi:hypothetical protein